MPKISEYHTKIQNHKFSLWLTDLGPMPNGKNRIRYELQFDGLPEFVGDDLFHPVNTNVHPGDTHTSPRCAAAYLHLQFGAIEDQLDDKIITEAQYDFLKEWEEEMWIWAEELDPTW